MPVVCVLVVQSCLTLCDPMDCSLPGSSVYGIFQARILDWRIPWTEEPVGLQSTGSQESDTTERLKRERHVDYFSGKK